METPNLPAIRALRPAWNKGRIVGQKRPLKPKHVWAIRVRLELAENHRDLALFGLPPLKWSSAMFRKTEEVHGKQAPKAGRDCHEVTAG